MQLVGGVFIVCFSNTSTGNETTNSALSILQNMILVADDRLNRKNLETIFSISDLN
jgi:hypothetical protein